MREMKDSGVDWIGEIPKEWQVLRNKNTFSCSKELVGKRSSITQLLSLTTKGIKEKDINNPVGKLPETFDTYQFVKLNDLVMCLFDLDCSAVFSGISSYSGMISPAYRVLTCLENMMPTYADYWFKYISDGRKFNHYSKNIRYTISLDEFKTLPILVPNIFTQHLIADYLDTKCSKIDTVIAREQAVIEKLKEYKLSVITEAVTKALNPNVPMKDSGIEWIGEIPEGWKVRKIKMVANLNPSINNYLSECDEVGYVPMDCVKNGYMLSKTIEYGKISTGLTCFENGDILLAKVTPCFENGNIAIADRLKNNIAFGSSELFVFRTNNIGTKFLYYFMQNNIFKEHCISTMTGTGGLKRISSNFVKNYKFACPFQNEQQQIVNYLDNKCTKIDSAISRKQAVIDKLTEYKKSLIYEVVTGKKEV